ncbi:RsmE family RNA methyltransferase [Anaerorhabdus furcosa]|uniref:Ribosomal RNA small subunit methyltransferase E n=1 Tax=Anaerorhabdus furcosa TaxID=118967 RepID=A0A1T4N824_9FIRM|nr:RsmE family RNA methyltransferase [Anaerorhabdus furcosa]SJZ75275.1 16S rRNA (uracil1498-N3)-methyltransferase [Anaerorhabdus furcosa]
MQQYFINNKIEQGAEISFDKEQTHHIKDVLRMKEGTCIRLVNQEKEAGFASIFYRGKDVVAHINELDQNSNDMKCKITLCVGLIKKEKWDYLLQKCTELGVSEIVPFESSRTIVKAKDEKVSKKLERWHKILLEAAEQCKRNSCPNLVEPIGFKEITQYKSEINCVAYEDVKYIGEKLRDIVKQPTSITIVVGPEGGFDPCEVEYLLENNFHCITLGKRILRAETATTYVLSAIDALVE